MTIKAIETEYRGYRFRSRLEARWAVFFDALGVKYEYEPEGFMLPSGRKYLPDFRVKCYGLRGSCGEDPFDLYIEVKGRMTADDASRIREFADKGVNGECEYEVGNPVLVVGDIPPEGCATDSEALGAYENMDGCDISPFNYELIDGDYFAAYPTAFGGRLYLMGDDGNYIDTPGVEKANMAYRVARQARFEHGEAPVVGYGG